MGFNSLGHRWCNRCGKLFKKAGKYSLTCSDCYRNPQETRALNKSKNKTTYYNIQKLSRLLDGPSLFDDE